MTSPMIRNRRQTPVHHRGVRGGGAVFNELERRSGVSPEIPRMLKFEGYRGQLLDGRRKIYTSSILNDGVEVPEAAILACRSLPTSDTEPLPRDVVWVDANADIIYFTRRRRADRDPDGGTGFPRSDGKPGV